MVVNRQFVGSSLSKKIKRGKKIRGKKWEKYFLMYIIFREKKEARKTYLSEPVGVGEGEIWERSLPLHEVPGSSDVVVPRDDPLHGVANHVHVDGRGEVKSSKRRKKKARD